MSLLPIMLDGLMVVLLAVTIGYAAVLNRRLANWRNDKAELEKLIDRFNRAAQHADVGISTLKEASEQTGRALAQATAKGKSLVDDLAFLIERAEPLADRLTDRTRRAVRPSPSVAPAPEPYVIAAEPRPKPEPRPEPVSPAPVVSREPVPQSAPPARPVIRPYRIGENAPRASAERDLLKALSSLRKG